jgi:hypothetical protein
VLEASTNLTVWSGVSTNYIAATPATFTNSGAAARNFFRAYEIQQP